MAQHTKKSFLMILLQPYFTKKSANEVEVYPGTTLRSTGKNAKSNEIARRDIFVVRPWFLSSLSLPPPLPPLCRAWSHATLTSPQTTSRLADIFG